MPLLSWWVHTADAARFDLRASGDDTIGALALVDVTAVRVEPHVESAQVVVGGATCQLTVAGGEAAVEASRCPSFFALDAKTPAKFTFAHIDDKTSSAVTLSLSPGVSGGRPVDLNVGSTPVVPLEARSRALVFRLDGRWYAATTRGDRLEATTDSGVKVLAAWSRGDGTADLVLRSPGPHPGDQEVEWRFRRVDTPIANVRSEVTWKDDAKLELPLSLLLDFTVLGLPNVPTLSVSIDDAGVKKTCTVPIDTTRRVAVVKEDRAGCGATLAALAADATRPLTLVVGQEEMTLQVVGAVQAQPADVRTLPGAAPTVPAWFPAASPVAWRVAGDAVAVPPRAPTAWWPGDVSGGSLRASRAVPAHTLEEWKAGKQSDPIEVRIRPADQPEQEYLWTFRHATPPPRRVVDATLRLDMGHPAIGVLDPADGRLVASAAHPEATGARVLRLDPGSVLLQLLDANAADVGSPIQLPTFAGRSRDLVLDDADGDWTLTAVDLAGVDTLRLVGATSTIHVFRRDPTGESYVCDAVDHLLTRTACPDLFETPDADRFALRDATGRVHELHVPAAVETSTYVRSDGDSDLRETLHLDRYLGTPEEATDAAIRFGDSGWMRVTLIASRAMATSPFDGIVPGDTADLRYEATVDDLQRWAEQPVVLRARKKAIDAIEGLALPEVAARAETLPDFSSRSDATWATLVADVHARAVERNPAAYAALQAWVEQADPDHPLYLRVRISESEEVERQLTWTGTPGWCAAPPTAPADWVRGRDLNYVVCFDVTKDEAVRPILPSGVPVLYPNQPIAVVVRTAGPVDARVVVGGKGGLAREGLRDPPADAVMAGSVAGGGPKLTSSTWLFGPRSTAEPVTVGVVTSTGDEANDIGASIDLAVRPVYSSAIRVGLAGLWVPGNVIYQAVPVPGSSSTVLGEQRQEMFPELVVGYATSLSRVPRDDLFPRLQRPRFDQRVGTYVGLGVVGPNDTVATNGALGGLAFLTTLYAGAEVEITPGSSLTLAALGRRSSSLWEGWFVGAAAPSGTTYAGTTFKPGVAVVANLSPEFFRFARKFPGAPDTAVTP